MGWRFVEWTVVMGALCVLLAYANAHPPFSGLENVRATRSSAKTGSLPPPKRGGS